MQILIRQGKGKKDRYSLLAKSNLEILREYWKRYQPKEYLFSGKGHTDAITPRSVQKMLEKSIIKTKITKNATVHTLRHYVECLIMVSYHLNPCIKRILT